MLNQHIQTLLRNSSLFNTAVPSTTGLSSTGFASSPIIATPSIVGATSTSGSSSLDLTAITGLTEGDIVVFFASDDNNEDAQTVASSDWTTVVSDSDNSISFSISYKAMGTTPDTSVAVGSTVDALSAIALRGVSYDAISFPASASSTTITPPSVSVSADNAIVLILAAIDDDDSTISSASTGYTVQTENGRVGGSNAIMSKTGVSTGTESPSSLTWASTDALLAYTMSFVPATLPAVISAPFLDSPLLTIDVQAGALDAQSSGGISIPYPSDIESGDVLVAIVWCGGTTDVASTPSGWTQEFAAGNDYVYSKTAAGTETGSLTLSMSNTASPSHALMYRFRPNTSASFNFEDRVAAFYDTSPYALSFTAGSNVAGADTTLFLFNVFLGASRTLISEPTNDFVIDARNTNPRADYYHGFDIGGETISTQYNNSFSYALLRMSWTKD